MSLPDITRIVPLVASLLLFVTCAAAQSSGIDTKLAAQYFRQLKQTSDRAAVPRYEGEEIVARPLKGEGWSLELANGWEVVPGERAGDATVKKKS